MSSYINPVCESIAEKNETVAERSKENGVQNSQVPAIALETIAVLGTQSCPPIISSTKSECEPFSDRSLEPASNFPEIDDRKGANRLGNWSNQSLRMMYRQSHPQAFSPRALLCIDKLHQKWFECRLSTRPVSFMFDRLSREIPFDQIEVHFTAYALDQIEKGKWRYKSKSKYLDAANATQVFLYCEEFMLAFQSGRTVSLHRDLKNTRDQKCILSQSRVSKTVRINAEVKTIQEYIRKTAEDAYAKITFVDFGPHNPLIDGYVPSFSKPVRTYEQALAKLDWYYANYPLPIDALMTDAVVEDGQYVHAPVSQEIKEFYQKAIEQIEAPGLQNIQSAAREFILKHSSR